MHPFNSNYSRERGPRQQGYSTDNHSYNNAGRRPEQCGNGNQFPVQNYYGNNSQMCTDMHGNNRNRRGFQGGWNNFNPPRQFPNQQFWCHEAGQSEEQNRRQMEQQRRRSYLEQFGHPDIQQNEAQFNRHYTNSCNGRNYHPDHLGDRRCSPEFDGARHSISGLLGDFPRGRQTSGFQHLERRQNQQDTLRQLNFSNNDMHTNWDWIKPKLVSLMEIYFDQSSEDFSNEQQPMRNSTQYRGQATSFQKSPSFQKCEKKKKRGPFGRNCHANQATKVQTHSNDNGSFDNNFSDGPTHCDNKEIGIVKDSEKLIPAIAAGTLSDKSLSVDHSPQKYSESQNHKLTGLDTEGENGSNSDDRNKTAPTTGDGNSKVSHENNQNQLCDIQTESNPSLGENQQNKAPSPRSELVDGSDCHTTQTDESAVEHVQQSMELVSLDSQKCAPQDNQGQTGSPKPSKDAQNFLARPTSTEKNQPISPAMKERKQFFGASLQKGGVGTPKCPETGKTWSSVDYFTGGGQGKDKPIEINVGSENVGTSTLEGVSETCNNTITIGNRDKDEIPVVGEKSISRSIEEQTDRGNQNNTSVPRRGRDGNWKQHMSNYREGNVEIQDRRDLWQTHGRESNRAERTMRDQGKDSYTGDQPSMLRGRETYRKPEGNKVWQQRPDDQGEKVTDRMTYRDSYQPDDRRPYDCQNRFSDDREKQRHFGSPQPNSPRSRQDRSNYYSQNRHFDRNRAHHYINSREELEMEPRRRTENEYRRSRDSGNTFSPHGRNQGQVSYSSGRSYNSDGCNDNKTRSSYTDLSSDGRIAEKIGSTGVGGTLKSYTDKKCVPDHKMRSKSFDGSKEQSGQSSAGFQSTDLKMVQSTRMEQDQKNSELKEPDRKDIEQKINKQKINEQKTDEARNTNEEQRSMVDSTISGQKSDNAQRNQTAYKAERSGRTASETEVSTDAGDKNQYGQDMSFAESKELPSQCSTNFQSTDQKIVKPTVMEQDPKICTKESENESNSKAIEQKTDEAGNKSTDQSSSMYPTNTEQMFDKAQQGQIIEKSGNNSRIETEMEVVIGNDDHGQDSSLQSNTTRPEEKAESVSNHRSTVHQDSSHSHTETRTSILYDVTDSNQDKKEPSPPQFTQGQLDLSERQEHLDEIETVFPKQNSQENLEYSQQAKSFGKHHTQTSRVSAQEQFEKGFVSTKSDKNPVCSFDKNEDARSPLSTRYLDEGEGKSFGKEGHSYKQTVSMKLFDVCRMGSSKNDKDGQSPKRRYTYEGESPRHARQPSGSNQGIGSSKDSDTVKDRNRNVSGGSTHSSDTGRSRSHSRDIDSHVKDKRTNTSHRHKCKKVAREGSYESSLNSDSSSGYPEHSHRHRHRSKGDKSNSHRHSHRSKGDSWSQGERKESCGPRSKDMGTRGTNQSTDKQRGGDTNRYSRLEIDARSWKEKDHYAGGSDVDIDEEDSDDELETPFFLTSLTEASSRPIPSTPTKGINASHTESPNPSCSPQISLAPLSSFNSGFSLDVLLAEAIDKTSEERQCEDMHAALEEGLRKGGFVKDTLEVTEEPAVDDLLPEHQLELKKFQICKSEMSEVHPGENIFLGNRYQCLFNADVSLQACGFVPGTTYIDKHLISVQPADYMTLLTSDIMLMCFDAISCQDAVLRWLLFIMSVHPSHLLINCCYKTVQEHLYSCQHFTCKTKYTWSPAVTDILSILCNYGADGNKLLPKSLVPDTEYVRNSLFQQNMEIPQAGKYNRENFRLVLNSLAMAFQIRPKYTDSQVTQMIVMLCKAALDKSLNNFMLTHEFEVVLASLLKLYTDIDWTTQSLTLCRELSCLTEHHHNQVYLAQLLPPTTKGNFLQRRVSFLMIHKLFYPEQKVSDDVIMQFQLNRVHNVLPKLQGLADEDIYLLSSCVSLLDLCIGNGLIKSAEKGDLEYITEQMKKLTGEVRDNVQMLDKTRIKDMMIRITSKWTLVLLSIGSKQKTLFECPGNFRKSPAELKIETVDASQTDHASETEEEDSQSEEEDQVSSEKPKTKVKTVTIDVKDQDACSTGDDRMDVDEDDDDLPEL
ncbi:uncharacterized protein LOC117338819 isoform X2 [Pecten maximus]|uniref:uncharacterized protein LOC117338819 isoform X2 n=1 Tax=Pecten maximus TaxID=6579 RepID=UPI00145867B5|nr:uncharacterized protein LOC117338819 isoform X2 [Pecten maximus]